MIESLVDHIKEKEERFLGKGRLPYDKYTGRNVWGFISQFFMKTFQMF